MGSARPAAPLWPALLASVLAGCGSAAAPDGGPAPEEPSAPPSPLAPAAHVLPSFAPTPFGARPDEWTWVDFPDARCGNGSPTGLAVDVHPGATTLLLFLQGGGACDDAEGCWLAPTAVHMDGYGLAQLATEPQLTELSLFSRDGANPFAGASYVFVPYCTGDLHAGDDVATYAAGGRSFETWHYGAHDVDVLLPALAHEFRGIDRVWLAGQSAGGFGTLFNEDFVARAFGVRTDVMDDSGPGVGTSGFPESWNVRLPPGCAGCGDGLAPLFLYDRTAYPDARFAFLSFQSDDVLPGFYRAPAREVDGWLARFEQGLAGGAASFVAPGAGHVVTGSPLPPATGRALTAWLAAMANDATPLQSVAP